METIVTRVDAWRKHPELVQGYTDRLLGNLSYRSAARKDAYARRLRLAEELDIDPKRMFSIPLGHTNRVAILQDASFLDRLDGRGYLLADPAEIIDWPELTAEEYVDMPKESGYVDGVVFDVPDVYSLVITADCAAVGFYDPVRRVCGNAHAGLLGAVNQLPQAMVAAMVGGFGCRPTDIEAVIFPCIRQCHYDTSNSRTWLRIKEDVFAAYGEESPFYASGFFDLPGFIRLQLIESGLPENHIHDTGICTVCNYDAFYSHVGAGSAEAQAVEGRFGAVVGVRG